MRHGELIGNLVVHVTARNASNGKGRNWHDRRARPQVFRLRQRPAGGGGSVPPPRPPNACAPGRPGPRRDSEWMGQIYNFLGLTVGVIVHGLDDAERKEAYSRDITYGTNNEYGFDYLRDNMKYRLEDMVQRGHFYAIVDEVDSILIDEARTPLIISGPLDDRSDCYNTIYTFLPKPCKSDYDVAEKQTTVTLTEAGMEKIETLLRDAGQLKGESLYDVENVSVVHHINQALRAHSLFTRDKDYIVRDDEVIIIDEFTGRMMPG